MKMRLMLFSLWIIVIIWQPTYCFSKLCNDSENTILSDEECSELYFGPSDKTTNLGLLKFELDDNVLRIIPLAASWSKTFLKVSMPQNKTNVFCSRLLKKEELAPFCVYLEHEMQNETFLIDYKIENLPEISSRKFLFTLPNPEKVPLFLYIDQTDTTRLILNAQKLPSLIYNVTYYKVEAYKEKSGNTNLQDFRLFSSYDDIYYELFTYNDVGNYYFVVSIITDDCTENSCLKITSPKVFIGRKSTRVVIGIVGASFILPFVLFLFHVLTKKYPDESHLVSEEKLVIAYKSSSKKHNEVVFALAALLEKMCKNDRIAIDVIDLSKTTKKLCNDPLIAANRVICVAPPKNITNPILINKSLAQKELFAVVFDHCNSDTMTQFIDSEKVFKLFQDFDEFIRALNISGTYSTVLYQDLKRKTEEAKLETDRLNTENLPKIIITEMEPQECDSLMSTKVML